MANIIETLEQEEIARLGKKIPKFSPGDLVKVGVNVVEGTRKRVQIFEGIVISRKNRGLNSSFIVRKISSGEGIERTFQLHSPQIESIEIKSRGDVRRAKLFYLRKRSGKSARIKERLKIRDSDSEFEEIPDMLVEEVPAAEEAEAAPAAEEAEESTPATEEAEESTPAAEEAEESTPATEEAEAAPAAEDKPAQ